MACKQFLQFGDEAPTNQQDPLAMQFRDWTKANDRRHLSLPKTKSGSIDDAVRLEQHWP